VEDVRESPDPAGERLLEEADPDAWRVGTEEVATTLPARQTDGEQELVGRLETQQTVDEGLDVAPDAGPLRLRGAGGVERDLHRKFRRYQSRHFSASVPKCLPVRFVSSSAAASATRPNSSATASTSAS
jgi:hypothetical protein